jgi:Collagen triple helix repeat (20 copies)
MARRLYGLAAIAAAVVLGSGIAYAAIPDSSGAFTACMVKTTGTVRLIDPSLGSSSLLGHCTSLETRVSWNQTGKQGPPGATGSAGPPGATGSAGPPGATGSAGPPGATGSAGPPGPTGSEGSPGKDGQSVTEAPADSTACPTGGVALTAANGTTNVCSGATGATGPQGEPGTAGVAGYEVVVASAPLAGTRSFSETASCPAGKKLVGGGFNFEYAIPASLNIENDGPSPSAFDTTWEVDAFYSLLPDDAQDVVRVYAYCVIAN